MRFIAAFRGYGSDDGPVFVVDGHRANGNRNLVTSLVMQKSCGLRQVRRLDGACQWTFLAPLYSQPGWSQCSSASPTQECPMTSCRKRPVMHSAPSLQNTIFFCMSITHIPVSRLSRILRQISGPLKADIW